MKTGFLDESGFFLVNLYFTEGFAAFRHSRVHHLAQRLRGCLSALLGVEVPMDTWEVASLTLSLGGLRLLSAQRVQFGSRQRVRPRRVGAVERRNADLGSCRLRGIVHLVEAAFPAHHSRQSHLCQCPGVHSRRGVSMPGVRC